MTQARVVPAGGRALLAALALLAFPAPAPAAAAARELPVACTVADAALADVRMPFDLALERAGEAVLLRVAPSGTAHEHLLLRMPGCAVVSLAAGALPPGVHPMSVRPGGARLVVAVRPPDNRPAWWYAPDAATPLAPVPAPEGWRVAGQPVLSDDGAWAAWVEQEPGTGRQAWRARLLAGAEERRGDPAAFGRGSYEVLGFDPAAGTMTFARNLAEIVVGDVRSAAPVGKTLRPGDVASQPGTFRRVGDGWFAWDAYRDDTPWRAAWSVAGRAGRYEAGWSKLIAHAAVNPAGTLAALSLDTRFGRIPLGGEALVLVRLADGAELVRRELPRFTRTRVAFLGDRHLAWTEGGRVLVGRVPE